MACLHVWQHPRRRTADLEVGGGVPSAYVRLQCGHCLRGNSVVGSRPNRSFEPSPAADAGSSRSMAVVGWVRAASCCTAVPTSGESCPAVLLGCGAIGDLTARVDCGGPQNQIPHWSTLRNHYRETMSVVLFAACTGTWQVQAKLHGTPVALASIGYPTQLTR